MESNNKNRQETGLKGSLIPGSNSINFKWRNKFIEEKNKTKTVFTQLTPQIPVWRCKLLIQLLTKHQWFKVVFVFFFKKSVKTTAIKKIARIIMTAKLQRFETWAGSCFVSCDQGLNDTTYCHCFHCMCLLDVREGGSADGGMEESV